MDATGLFILLLAVAVGTYDIINKWLKIYEWNTKYGTKPIEERRMSRWEDL